MKYPFFILMFMVSVVGSSAFSCSKYDGNFNIKNDNGNMKARNKIRIKVNSKTFTATLFENNTAKAFQKMLPMTISMKELNGDEKYYDLPERLPTNTSNPGTTKAGELMLFGSKTLMFFYKTSATSYSYTPLGRIDDISGLASALGSGNVTVTLETQEE